MCGLGSTALRAYVDPESRYQFGEFMKLYRAGIRVDNGKFSWNGAEYQMPLNEEMMAFQVTKGLPVVMVSPSAHNELMPVYRPFFEFYKNNQWFWMIPCEIPGKKIIGFLLRSLDKDGGGPRKQRYCLFQVKGTMPIAYGFHQFSNFKLDTTIVLTEGVKDALFLGQYYPYVVAVLTNSISEQFCKLLQRLTTKVILAFDVDKGGMKHTKQVSEKLAQLGISCSRPYTTYKVKDWANFFSVGLSPEGIREHIRLILSQSLNDIGDDAKLLY